MKLRVKSLRTGKYGYATEIHRDHGPNFWQVTDDECETIVFFPDTEFRRIFSIRGEVNEVPKPDWMRPERPKQVVKKGKTEGQMNLFTLSPV